MRNRVSIGEYLAFLSTKYQIDPDQFFHALALAEENKEVNCGKLTIKCRSKSRDKITVLIVNGTKVVAQFPVTKLFLLEQKNPIKDFIGSRFAGRRSTQKNGNLPSLRIRDLRKGMKQISLKAKILEIPAPKLVFTRFGNYASVSNAVITDETGTIKLCLWNEQITEVCAGDVVQIENASMSTFRGESQLRIGRKGKLSIGQPSPELQVPST